MSVDSALIPSLSPSPADEQRGGVRARFGPGAPSRSWLLLAIPALLAGAYLIVLLVDFTPVIDSINTYGDAVIAPVLGKLAGQAPPGSQIVLGHHPYYEEYLFLRATAGLSFYRALWTVAPFLWTLLGFGLLAWSAWRALGRVAAVLTTSALLCLGTLGRFMFFSFNWHGLTILHTILIACALVWLTPRAAKIAWWRLVGLAVALGAVSALPASSDVLFLVWGLAPMAIVALLLCYLGRGRERWTPVVFTLITVLVSLAGGALIGNAMRANRVISKPFSVHLIHSVGKAFHYVKLLAESLIAVGGGNVTAPLHGFLRYPKLINGVLLLLAFGLAVCGAVLAARRARRHARRSDVRDRGPLSPAQRRTAAYVTFWTSSLVVACLAYVSSNVPKLTSASARYALAAYVAAMALFPLMALLGPRWRRWISAGVCAFIVTVTVEMAVKPFVEFGPYPTPNVASRVLAFARAHDVKYGYASYWDGPAITWFTDFRLQLYPVTDGCPRYVFCRFQTARINSWYRPRPGTRSMVIGDSALAGVNSVSRLLGRPLATTRIGSLILAAYPYDVAPRLRLRTHLKYRPPKIV
jgi:hypothetical protein